LDCISHDVCDLIKIKIYYIINSLLYHIIITLNMKEKLRMSFS